MAWGYDDYPSHVPLGALGGVGVYEVPPEKLATVPRFDSYDGYCVKCKTKRTFAGEVKTSDSGRRMAHGRCPTCDTKINRILGRAPSFEIPGSSTGRFSVDFPRVQQLPPQHTSPKFTKRPVKKIYVAGPMRGYAEFNFPAFDAERDRLKALGYEVISPADMDREHGDTDTEAMTCPPIEDCMRRDIAALLEVDAIRFLPGWEKSEGALIEETVGKAIGLTLWYPEMKVPTAPFDWATVKAIWSKPWPAPSKETPLQEAQRLVHADRGDDYGHPLSDFTRTGKIWGAVLEEWRDSDEDAVPPELVGLCMVGVKISREVNKPKRDNRVDGAGYFETVDMVHQEQARRDLEDA